MNWPGVHFQRREFACQCGCGFAAADAELLRVLEDLRQRTGQPVVINSGCRCPAHNTATGGAANSYHLKGMAADFRVRGLQPAVVAKLLDEQNPGRYGIGAYAGWVHLDLRPGRARWGLT